MQEYLVYHEGQWWHFFIKPFYGLCFRKKEGSRFSNFEVLLPEACQDFCALSAGGFIHLVCQDKTGSILYLLLASGTWRKTVLLESKSATPYAKHFMLLAVGNFINLFYIIRYQEKYMLVHQMITQEDRPPTVIDRIFPATPPFSVMPHTGSDLMVLYDNEGGTAGTKRYHWSRKSFGRFMPVNPALSCTVRFFLPERGGRVRYAGFQRVENITNLVYFEQTAEGQYTAPVTVYLDCPTDSAPIFCEADKRLYLVWQEAGGILSAYSTDDGASWSKPVRYMVPAGAETVRYTISENGHTRYAYGFAKEQTLVLYAAPDLEDKAPPKEQPLIRPAGYEAEAFAVEQGGMEAMPSPFPNPMVDQLKQELSALKEQFLHLRLLLAELKERLEQLETASTLHKSPLAEDLAVDAVLLNNQEANG